MNHREVTLVSAPTAAGENFIKLLLLKGIPFAALVNNAEEKNRLALLGVEQFILLDTKSREPWMIPDFPIGNIYLFENTLPLCCRYIQICRGWSSKRLIVITGRMNPRGIYKGLGANEVIYSKSDNLSFLVSDSLDSIKQ
ncbi:hypothetical protein [Paenibacillus glycanilyticus]|uniref:Response regulator receiver protein n=1 Tax=Paenibacillus glycanilyticus TaxID=126569 RepID=A0ABQ6G5W0_9BACL|nr:hypothetical protein [Paenibacillus glycanilyticus]GLX66361.1 hypothetical protein MU1_07050 [Paenibacillus glycanilyticus]